MKGIAKVVHLPSVVQFELYEVTKKSKLNHWWQMDNFHTLLGLDSVNYLAVDLHPKYLKLCSEDELSFYGFGMKCR